MVKLKIVKKYNDLELNKKIYEGETLEVSKGRARVLMDKGFGKILRINKLSEEREMKIFAEERDGKYYAVVYGAEHEIVLPEKKTPEKKTTKKSSKKSTKKTSSKKSSSKK